MSFAFYSLLAVLAACRFIPPEVYDPTADPSSDDGVVDVPGADHTSACLADDINPYDPGQVVSYTLDVDDQTLEMLVAIGYSWGDTYDQLLYYGESVTISAPGCDDIVFEKPRVGLGRQTGYQGPYGQASWTVEYNDLVSGQTIGGYDDARWWAPIYDGPVAELFLYEDSMDYLNMPHRYDAWMQFGTTWWGGQTAIYNALEPFEDDFAKRNGYVALWEGYDPSTYHPGSGANCKTGDCDQAGERAATCLERLSAISSPYAILAETSDCYDWGEIASVMAWQDWFGHWDGCGSNNCYGYFKGDAADSSTWVMGELVSGIDLLLNSYWTMVESADLSWSGGTFGWYCRSDTSPGGCRESYVAHMNELSALVRSGKMEEDLRETFALREHLDIALDGDDAWVEQAVDWVNARPDVMDAAIELLLYPCGRSDSGESGAILPPGGGGYYESGYGYNPCSGQDTSVATTTETGFGVHDSGTIYDSVR